jgi:hypothetical protein
MSADKTKFVLCGAIVCETKLAKTGFYVFTARGDQKKKKDNQHEVLDGGVRTHTWQVI